MAEMNDDELLGALGVEVTPIKSSSRSPKEERIIAGFENILRFYQTQGRAPLHGEDRDIFERLYAVRLDQLRKLPEAQACCPKWTAQVCCLEPRRLMSTSWMKMHC